MRGKPTLYLLALSLISPGCSLISDGVHLVCTEFAESTTESKERHRNREWAEAAWAEISSAAPRHEYSEDYAQGFKDGFAEYVYHGEAEPPVVAPERYERFRYQTPEGYHAIEDWFAGYRRGSAAAREGNYRRWIAAPFSLTQPGVLPDDLAGSAQGRHPVVEELPSHPRKVLPPQAPGEPTSEPSVPPPVEKALPAVDALPHDATGEPSVYPPVDKLPPPTDAAPDPAKAAWITSGARQDAEPQPRWRILRITACPDRPASADDLRREASTVPTAARRAAE